MEKVNEIVKITFQSALPVIEYYELLEANKNLLLKLN